MKKTAVVYWSGTGNTEAMAEAVLTGMKDAGADAAIYTAAEFSPSKLSELDAVAFGCPAMGAEMLEESEFEPMFNDCKGSLGGKKVGLFGSYGWGDGDWMRSWEEDCSASGIKLCCESVTCNEAPDAQGLAACRLLGKLLAE